MSVTEQLRAHVDEIFTAYFAADRQTIHDTHSEDWTGFLLNGRELVQGREHYMNEVDKVLHLNRGIRYEMLEFKVREMGDVALVFYIAKDWLEDKEGKEFTVILRCLDVYRREGDGWIQCASNICILPPETSDIVPTNAG